MEQEVKKTVWSIDYSARMRDTVVFEEPVTSEEASELFHNGLYIDTIDTETMNVDSVGDAE